MLKRFLVCLVCIGVMLSASHSAYAQQVESSPDGLVWVSWLNAGERIWKAVMRIEPKMKDVIGDGKTVAVAVQDLDYDGQNDMILRFWGAQDCGADGCLYVVLTYNGRTKRAFVANEFKRSGSGMSVDGRYYPL